jgi:hypothetical protein
MSQLLGGGVIETFCPACGFAMRQSIARPARDARTRWHARFDALRTFALPVPPAADASAAPGFRFTGRRLVALGFLAVFVVAMRAMFVGYPSFEPVLFSELYVMLFAFVLFWLMFARTAQDISGRQVLLLFIGAVAGAALAVKAVKVWNLVPSTWEPDYCGDIGYPHTAIDFRLPPKTFRCMSIPIAIAGWFLGWLVAYWLITRWERAGRQTEAP